MNQGALKPGFHLIEASAGTGKTYAITSQYLYLLLETRLRVDQILVVTFTKAATAELKDRIRSRIRDVRDFLAGGQEIPMPDPEFQSRILTIVGERTEESATILTHALSSFDDAAIYTIHGFCQRVLGEHAFLTGGNLEFDVVDDETPFVDAAVNDFIRRRVPGLRDPEYTAFVDGSRLVDPGTASTWDTAGRLVSVKMLRTLLNIATNPFARFEPAESNNPAISVSRELINNVKDDVPRRKKAAGVTSYTDLLLGVFDGVRGSRGDRLAHEIRSEFRAALVDEFQDTDPLQYEIFRKVYEGSECPVLFVGDPKQAIYSFRGGDIFAYFDATARISPEHRAALGKNFRSSKALVENISAIFRYQDAANAFADNGRTTFPDVRAEYPAGKSPKVLPEIAGRSPLHWFLLPDPGEKTMLKPDAMALSCRAMVEEIQTLIPAEQAADTTHLMPGDIAVLVRTHDQAALAQRNLLAAGIPSVMRTQDDVFNSPEAEELLRLLRAIATPDRDAERGAAMISRAFGYTAPELLTQRDDLSATDEVLGEFGRLRGVWSAQREGFILMARDLLYRSTLPAGGKKMVEWLGELANCDRVLTNYFHLIELLHQESVLHPGVDHLVGWFGRRIGEASEENAEHAMRLESDEKRVQIVTIHSSKGLEYPVVFIPFGFDGVAVTQQARGVTPHHDEAEDRARDLVINLAPKSDKQSESHFQAYRAEQISESLRLLYVALTRARQRCYVTWGWVNMMDHAALTKLLFGLGASTKKLGYAAVLAPLHELIGKSKGQMSESPVFDSRNEHVAPSPHIGATTNEQAARTFARGTVERSWGASSYTSLTKNTSAASRDRDTFVTESAQRALDESSIFAFPAGARTGIAWHELFEELNFQATDDTIEKAVAMNLWKHNIGSRFEPAMLRMVKSTLDAPMGNAQVRLRTVPAGKRLHELDFLFSMERCDMEEMKKILQDAGNGLPPEFREASAELQPRHVRGFMTGAIDLLFAHDERMFIADYKSNHLGNAADAYGRDRLIRAMAHEHYYLQYLIYVVAVTKYLRQRKRDFEYDRHFGGVAYLFLRGIGGDETGIFFDRPSRGLIDSLESHFRGE